MASPTDLIATEVIPAGREPDPSGPEPSGLFGDAWRDLRRNPVFWVSVALLILVVTMAAAPQLFTSADPQSCQLSRQHAGPSGSAIFGYNFQGCDVFARTVYGARASITVGLLGVAIATVLALVVGMSAGFFGGWIDAVLSRIIDIVLGIPYLLAAIVLARRLTAGRDDPGLLPVVLVLGALGWT
jgi:ABC-type dipeptide/oligopeptide/nickel transport system permease subunit